MILDQFSGRPGYPFERYFADADAFEAAQQYRLAVLRAAEGFDEANWQPAQKHAGYGAGAGNANLITARAAGR